MKSIFMLKRIFCTKNTKSIPNFPQKTKDKPLVNSVKNIKPRQNAGNSKLNQHTGNEEPNQHIGHQKPIQYKGKWQWNKYKKKRKPNKYKVWSKSLRKWKIYKKTSKSQISKSRILKKWHTEFFSNWLIHCIKHNITKRDFLYTLRFKYFKLNFILKKHLKKYNDIKIKRKKSIKIPTFSGFFRISHRINIRLVPNNIFCSIVALKVKRKKLIKKNTNNTKNLTMETCTSGKYKVKLSKKSLKYMYKPILKTFFNKVWKVRKKMKRVIFTVSAPKNIRRNVFKTIRYRFRKAKKPYLIHFYRNLAFNGCRPRKQVRKKRKSKKRFTTR